MQQHLPKNIVETSKLLQQGLLSSHSLTQHYLDRIHQLNPTLNAFITITDAFALYTAEKLDDELRAGKYRGTLHGIPIVIKDNIDTVNILTTVGSELYCDAEAAVFGDRIPPKDADIVAKLTFSGAIILGKTNLSEFAADITGDNRFYGNVRNAINPNYSPGGSSSGTATAVAANMCLGGIGTDTGGSIRIPASWSGVVGMRPTQALISTKGVFPRASSFDTIGVMASTVADTKVLFDAIIPSLVDIPQTSYRLGIIANYTWRGVDTEVATAIYRVLSLCKQNQIEVITIENEFLSRFDATNYSTIALYEFSQTLRTEYQQNSYIFGDKVKNDLKKGTAISHQSYCNAQKQRQEEINRFQTIFERVDAIITPTTPTTAPQIPINSTTYKLSRQFVVPFSYLGLPAISIPSGVNQQGLPIGLQIIGNHFQDRLILQIATDLASLNVIYPTL
jgi:aspartyl-tRNA(Asn)/glutamyl-tRNA(Gln) amidotransferase subunit A